MSKTFKVGDRVKVLNGFNKGAPATITQINPYAVSVVVDGYPYEKPKYYHSFGFHELELIAEEDKPMKTWGEMTREEKGELLLAHHEGKTIEYSPYGDMWFDDEPKWHGCLFYRVKPEPEVKTKEVFSSGTFSSWGIRFQGDTHKITFDVVDGVVDCNSVKMEEL